MNQILDYGTGNNDNDNGKSKKNKNKKNNNYENNYYSGGKTSTSDKVVKVFAFLMIVLAIALITSGVYSIFSNKKVEKEQKESKKVETEVKAEILAELDETTGKVNITVNSPVTISKLICSWDQDHDNVIAGNKQTSMTHEVDAPYGEHVLHIQVTDEQNNKTTQDFTFDSPTGMDTTNPEIVLSITEDKKLLITATDDTSIDYVTYSWNEGEVITKKPDEEGAKELEFELEIPKGKNTIVVYAVDGSDHVTPTTKVFEGVTKPEVTCGYVDNERKSVQVFCTHENGIKSLYYTINGEPKQWQAPEGQEAPKELSFIEEATVVGHNEILGTVTSVDDTVFEINIVWDYGVTIDSENDVEADNESSASNETDNETRRYLDTDNQTEDEDVENTVSNES